MTTTDGPDRTPFPEGFSWGTATAAHQIEGGNWNNDWWAFEHTDGSGTSEPSGDACDSWHRWETDADIVASLGLDSYRFSIEWSRIEPEPGLWSIAALDHYARQCDGLRARGIDPVVTFHHFSSPRWVAAAGGWESDETVERFAEFCARAGAHLGTDRVARAWTQLRVLRYTALRTLRSSGAELSGHEASISKLQWANWHRALGELAVDVQGVDALVAEWPYDLTDAQTLFLFTRSDTIYGGSNEIQRNILAERMLGLPR
mgnify:CR=1 FL=1